MPAPASLHRACVREPAAGPKGAAAAGGERGALGAGDRECLPVSRLCVLFVNKDQGSRKTSCELHE